MPYISYTSNEVRGARSLQHLREIDLFHVNKKRNVNYYYKQLDF